MRRRQVFAAQTAISEAAKRIIAETSVTLAPALTNLAQGPLTVGTPFKPDTNACPKCGKVVTRGKFMHQKHCKGSAT